MVQDVELILNRYPCAFQVGECADDIAVFHVPGRVIIGTYDHDPGMAAVGRLNEIVKVQEIIVVPVQEYL
jgi:hypothetical protein